MDVFQLLDLNITYTIKLKNEWRFGIRFKPGISSNLEANDLTFEDLVFLNDIALIKDKTNNSRAKRPFRLIPGVSYSQNRGFPFPLPFVSYYRKLNNKWSYNLGGGKTNIQYHFSKSKRKKAFVQLDGFTAHIQKGVVLDAGFAERINMSLMISGLQYEYHFGKHFEIHIQTAYLLRRDVYLRNTKNENILLIHNSNGASLRAGIKFKI